MISTLTITVSLLSALTAALACAAAHRHANKRKWGFVERYAFGVTAIGIAFAAPLFTALPAETAGTLLLLLGIIVGATGLATWMSYDSDKPAKQISADDLERYAAAANHIVAEHDDQST
jgi:hypothetical protein